MLKIDAVEPYSEQKAYSRVIFHYGWIFFFNFRSYYKKEQGSIQICHLKIWMVAGHMEISSLGLPRVKWSKTTAWAVV